MSRIRGPKDYGEKDMLGKPTKRKSIFSGPLFPKGTGGLFPKYDAGLRKKIKNLNLLVKHSKWLKVKRLLPTKVSHMLELLKMKWKNQDLNHLELT
jgi:hypothetical protein